MRRSFRALLCGVLWMSGCLLDLDDAVPRRREPERDREFWVATGTSHAVELTPPRCGNSEPLFVCVDHVAQRLESVRVDPPDAFETHARVKDGSVLVELTAESPSDAQVVVAYEDRDGETRRVRFEAHARDVAHARARVGCDGGVHVEAPATLAPTSNLTLYVDAWSKDGNLLASGDLSLLDPGSFEVRDARETSSGRQFALTAPASEGKHALTLLGGEVLDLHVRHAAEVELTFEDADPEFPLREATASLHWTLSGMDSCLPVEPAPVWVEAEGEDCSLVFGGVRAAGALPVEIGEAPTALRVVGSGECTLRAHADRGSSASHMLTLPTPISVEVDPARRLGQLPLATVPHVSGGGRSCDEGITDGKCEFFGIFPDGDCLTDADWTATHADAEGEIQGFVGVGLWTYVRMGVVVGPDSLQGHRAPVGVGYRYDDRLFGLLPGSSSDVDVDLLEGCNAGGESRTAVIVARGVGAHQIEFEADNINDTLEVSFTAWNVDEVKMRVLTQDARVDTPRFPIFAGSQVGLAAEFESRINGKLRGIGTFHAWSDLEDSDAWLSTQGSLNVGSAPQVLSVGSPLGDGEQTLEVVDESAVSSLDFGSHWLALDEEVCVEVAPLDAEGRRIHGTPPARPALSLDGDAVVMLDPAEESLCVRARAAGSVEGTLTLGDAIGHGQFHVR